MLRYAQDGPASLQITALGTVGFPSSGGGLSGLSGTVAPHADRSPRLCPNGFPAQRKDPTLVVGQRMNCELY
ncbi:hypothetical protein EYF80_025027 [Liparis tanakae]|uniref:Uncharacterized protein n=1 Tax=Liparis tanakae TaxID=230148 RepID=A0A4Z2HGJ1_9TELE|nr:hypothetical protein EYF80_025027 [Liparis tanakae]